MKMEFAKGNGYKLPVARYQERQPNGKKYVTRTMYGTNLGYILLMFDENTRQMEESWSKEDISRYAYDIRVVCGDVVIAEKVWER